MGKWKTNHNFCFPIFIIFSKLNLIFKNVHVIALNHQLKEAKNSLLCLQLHGALPHQVLNFTAKAKCGTVRIEDNGDSMYYRQNK